MKVIISGFRNFHSYNKLKAYCDNVLSAQSEIEIVSGGADGADSLGERYAKENGYKLTVFKADWDKHGKAAGQIRNAEMAKYADALICFWDGQSRGSKNMIEEAKKAGLKYRVVSIYKLLGR